MSGDDATVLRAKSRTGSTGGSGEAAPTPRVLKSRFVLDEKLGSGGMGTVYRAKDLRKVEARDRFPYVAIKVLNSDVREHPEAFISLEREASKSQQLAHPNIVSIFDFDKDGNVPFITMELLQGRELADLLHAYPNGLPDDLARKVIRGLCDGLRYAHDNGVVHADFKPGNVFVTSQDVAKILDFGIARAVQVRPDHGEDTVFDPARMAALTPVYASLEMIRGDNPEQRDDIYSLGIVIYMVLTGHHPYGRLSADEALAEGLEPERPKQLGMRQWRVLSKALSFYRQNRPQSVAELEQAFFGRTQWRSRALAAAGVLLAVFAGSFAVIEGAQIDEVKAEVRQTTLLDAQAARVSGHLTEDQLDAETLKAIADELDRLRALDTQGAYHPALRKQFGQRIEQALAAAASWPDTTDLYEARRQIAASPSADALLRVAAEAEFARLSSRLSAAEQGVNDAHTDTVKALLALEAQLAGWPGVLDLAPRLQALGHQLGERALVVARAGKLSRANDLLVLAEPLAPQAERLQALHGLAEAEAAQAQAAQRQAREARELAAAEEVFEAGCLRLDLTALEAPRSAGARRYVDAALSDCVQRLGRVDAQQARLLQRDALARFGTLPRVEAIDLDPCRVVALPREAPQCRDAIAGGGTLMLTVVPAADGKRELAVTPEISGAEFLPFCAAVGLDCADQDAELPVTGLDAQTVERYARWLSETTGFAYRLPQDEEWALFAAAQNPGTVNCGARLLGGKRLLKTTAGEANSLGLHHVLGNVAEIVRGDAGYYAVGGSIADAGKCAAASRVALDAAAREHVGFRLLRELS